MNINSVFLFSRELLCEICLILGRTEQDMTKNICWSYVNYTLFVSEFNETCIFLTDFRKVLKYQSSWKVIQWELNCSMWTDGQTDRQSAKHDETHSCFSQFCECAWLTIFNPLILPFWNVRPPVFMLFLCNLKK